MSDLLAHPWRIDESGLFISMRLTPRGGRESIDGIITLADGRHALAARVRQVPENSAANTALIRLISKTIGVRTSAINIVSGQTSRLKTLYIFGDGKKIEAAIIASINCTL